MTAAPLPARSAAPAVAAASVLFCALLSLWLGVFLAAPAAAQEDEPAETTSVVVPEPAVPAPDDSSAPPEPEWSYRFLVPAALLLGTAAVVGAIIMYFVRVTKNRYRVIK